MSDTSFVTVAEDREDGEDGENDEDRGEDEAASGYRREGRSDAQVNSTKSPSSPPLK